MEFHFTLKNSLSATPFTALMCLQAAPALAENYEVNLTRKSGLVYETPCNRYFYLFEPPCSLHAVDEALKAVSADIVQTLGELVE